MTQLPPESHAVVHYDDRHISFEDDWKPLPMDSPMSRSTILERLQRAAAAELMDPVPDASLDGGSVEGLGI